LLSRPADTPRVLAELDVVAIAQGLVEVLHRLHRLKNYGVNLKYALLAVGGLLRVREHDPWALLADRSLSAKRLVEVHSDITAQIEARVSRVPAGHAKLNSARQLQDLITGSGGRPDILMVMEKISET
jgi:hypothetical protein